VAGESCNCASNDFRLTDGIGAFPWADFGMRATFGRAIGVLRSSLSQPHLKEQEGSGLSTFLPVVSRKIKLYP